MSTSFETSKKQQKNLDDWYSPKNQPGIANFNSERWWRTRTSVNYNNDPRELEWYLPKNQPGIENYAGAYDSVKKSKSATRAFWLVLGTISLILGTIGIPLPLLPTTPFYILTAFAYAKVSRRLAHWFETNPFFGPRLKRIREKKGLSINEKIVICLMVYSSMGTLAVLFWNTRLYVSIIVLVVALIETLVMAFHVPTYKKTRGLKQDHQISTHGNK